MIAAAIVCAAVASQAATVNWQEAYGICYPESEYVGAQGLSAYLIQTSAHSQGDFVTAFNNAGSASAFSSTVAGWNAVNAPATLGEYGDFDVKNASSAAFTAAASEYAYVVVVDAANDRIFMGNSIKTAYNGMDASNPIYSFTWGEEDFNAGLLPVWDASLGNQGAGWYAAGSSPTPTPTPEPTSGLLLLLGVAGLALRRRRA